MGRGDLLVDRLVAGGFVRLAVLLRGLQLRRPALSSWRVSLGMGLSGLVVESLAWVQSWLFPAGQLVELSYEALIGPPLVAVKRIYDELGLSSWSVAQVPLQARIAQALSYTSDPVTLPLSAQQSLNDLMEEA